MSSPRRSRVRRYGRGARNAAMQIRPQRKLAVEPPAPTEYTTEFDHDAVNAAIDEQAVTPADHEQWAPKRDAEPPEPEPTEPEAADEPAAEKPEEQTASASDDILPDEPADEEPVQAAQPEPEPVEEPAATTDEAEPDTLVIDEDLPESEDEPLEAEQANEDAGDEAADADAAEDEELDEPEAIELNEAEGTDDVESDAEVADETTDEDIEPVTDEEEPDGEGPGGWTAELDPDEPLEAAALSVAAGEAPAEGEYDDYVRQIEAAAARQRAGQKGETGASGAPLRPRRDVRAASSMQRAANGDARRRPPNGTQRRKRKDTRPWYRRPRTWVIALAMVPVIAVIVITLYLANILRLGYNAYQDINQDPVSDRVRYRPNAQGTPEAIPADELEQMLPNWDEQDPINILLLGIDSRPEDNLEENPPRSDTTIVVHIDPKTNQVAMMSIPRDLEVEIPGFGLNKLNAAYPLGEANADEIEGGGPTLVAQTIEANFPILIHYYATVNFEGFVEIIDTVGGVVVDVEAPLADNQYPTEMLGLTRVHFHTGLQKLDGQQALRYVRTRHGDNDIRRGDRQAQVLTAVQDQAMDLNLITRAEELLNGLSETFRTDLDYSQMLALANLGREIDMNAVQKVNLWDAGVLSEYTADDGSFFFIADWAAITGVLEEPFGLAGTAQTPPDTAQSGDGTGGSGGGAPTEPQLDVQVIVENGTDIPQLAGNAAQMLFDAGYSAVWPSDAPSPTETTIIYDSTNDAVTAQHVADVLGLPNAEIVPATDGEGITIVLGADVPATLVPTAEPNPEEEE